MIRYDIAATELIARIGKTRKTWLDRAKARTDEYRLADDYTGGSEFWGEIKLVYIRLQQEKCAYCETKLAGAVLASKVHEVEHFRPKSEVAAWPPTGNAVNAGFVPPCPVGGPSAKGYFLLAYHPFNYAIACTRCNSTLKSSYFPVRGQRNARLADPSLGNTEDALLIYPLSNIDDDPAALLTFDGVLAQPLAAAGPAHERAVVTITFFQLNHEDLTSRRAAMLWPLWLVLKARRVIVDPVLRASFDDAIQVATDASSAFAACARAFVGLHTSNPAHASELAQAARLKIPVPLP